MGDIAARENEKSFAGMSWGTFTKSDRRGGGASPSVLDSFPFFIKVYFNPENHNTDIIKNKIKIQEG